jgi:hypothetical protein
MAKQTTQPKKTVTKTAPKVGKTPETRTPSRPAYTAEDMVFGKQNYLLMGVGLLLVIIGFVLMSGGTQPDDSWNPKEIYSFTRTVLAPVFILAGLAVEIFAIFKK